MGVEEPEFQALEFVVALRAQVDHEPPLEEFPKPDTVEITQLEPQEGQCENARRQSRDGLHGGPVRRRSKRPGPMWRAGQRIHCMPQRVDAQTRQPHRGDSRAKEGELGDQHLETAPTIAPCEPQQSQDQLGIGELWR